MAKIDNAYDDAKFILNKMRNIQEQTRNDSERQKFQRILTEADEKKVNAIAITDDAKFGQNTLSNQIEQFRASVESGAQFSKPGDKVSECPLIYLKDTGNLVFSGIIPCLNNLKWQFVLKTSTGNGCFIWSDGLILSKDNLLILNKLFGFYLNWRESWNIEAGDLEKMAESMDM